MRSIIIGALLLIAALVSPAQRATMNTNGQSPEGLSGVYDVSRALVIGINDYRSKRLQKLSFAAQDANEVANELERDYGFQKKNVVRLIDKDATLERIRHALNALARAGKNDRVLIFFAGHGANRNGSGFLLPVDAEIDPADPASYGDTCLPMEILRVSLAQCPAKHILVLADACFSGFVAQRGTLAKEAAAELMRRTVKEAISAGTSEEESGEDPALGHGIFTYYLLEALRAKAGASAGPFTAQDLFAAVQTAVMSRTDSRQKPQLMKLDGGSEFVFNAPESAKPNIGGTPKTLPTDAVLSVSVTPPDATVEVDGKVVAAESTIQTGPGGKKTVSLKVSKPGYKTATYQIEVTPGQTTPVSVQLEAAGGGDASIGSHKVSAQGDVDMVYVPAGDFARGTIRFVDAEPEGKVYMSSYWIGKNDVTVAQFRAYCQASSYAFNWSANQPAWGWKDDHPMVNVTWDEARAFCQWAGGDLPTEAQWEKAARGTDGRAFPWGNDWDPGKLWCSKSQDGDANSTAPVGSIPGGASPYGCLDMVGNASQWCLDWYGGYGPGGAQDPKGAEVGRYRVVRGGSWIIFQRIYVLCGRRWKRYPTERISALGFRLAGPA